MWIEFIGPGRLEDGTLLLCNENEYRKESPLVMLPIKFLPKS
jgi:hypothetical protein